MARDTNLGTQAQPWKTIGKATGLLQPGDTVLVKAGVYRETVVLSRSGTSTTAMTRSGLVTTTSPITIAAYPGHEGKVIINAAEPVTNWRKCTGPQDCAGNPNWSHIYWADVARWRITWSSANRKNCLRTNDRVSYTGVRGLTMRYAHEHAVWLYLANNMTIENNMIEYAFRYGIELQSTFGPCNDNQILHNTIRYSGYRAINVSEAAVRCKIEGNTVYATGVEHFGGDLMHGPSEGIYVVGPFARVYGNRIDRTGSVGLYLHGGALGREVAYNYITNSGLALSDVGAIYMAGRVEGPDKDSIHHNIVADTPGCQTMEKGKDTGAPSTSETYAGDAQGIYVDEEANNRIIEDNTVIRSGAAGIYFHWAPTNLVRRNTLYGNRMAQIRLSGKDEEHKALVEDVFLDNILFATDAQQRTLYFTMNYNNVHFGQSDRNYFYNPYADIHIFVSRYLTPSSGEYHDYLDLSGWQAMSGYDRNSREFSYLDQLPKVTLASPTKSRIVYNASLDVNTVDLGPDLYCDVQGNGIRGKLTLQPFESKILISAVDAVVTHQATNPMPADGGQVGVAPLLEWTAAPGAAVHHVYLGTDKNAVSAAGVASPLFRGRQTGASFSLRGLVQPGGRYFWRVDEVETDGTTIHKGIVWTFTVSSYLAIGDFESYSDTKGSRIEETWTDGSLNHTGSQVDRGSNSSTGPTDTAHGVWSMVLAYDNTRSPFVSEVERKFAPEQDWTAGETDTLSLWFRGDVVSFEETTPGTLALGAAGADIWGAEDEFRYAYQRLDGDGAIAARVDSLGNSSVWAKAGVMIRESLDPGSAHAFMAVTPDGRRAFQNRPLSKSAVCLSAHSSPGAISLPFWVKLERTGDRFTGYYSRDGVNWIRQLDTENTGSDASPNPQTIPMPARVYVGLALTSHVSGRAATARFSSVKITGSVTGFWQVADIGADHPGNSPDDLYVIVADSKGKSATVVHPDPGAVNAGVWTEWKIPLSGFPGVDLHRVRKMSLGVGGRESAISLGTGRIYIDDIRVLKP